MSLSIRIVFSAIACVVLTACGTPGPIELPAMTQFEEAQYASLYPYYAEICAVSQLGKKPGFGAEISSGFGGHAVLYLNGVCRKKDKDYPELEMCDASPNPTADGVGVSVNAHYKNADWVAVEGRDFFFTGGLKPGEALTPERYRAVQAHAMSMRIYDGVTFHDTVYGDMPPGFTRPGFQYEISVATDYAVAFGRNRYCARVPLNRSQTVKTVDYLNRLNAPYESGEKIFEWNLLNHNCSHINHNALAAADIWAPWETDRSLLVSFFDFPVPKNEFVNTMLRTNDMPIDDIEALYNDDAARNLMLHEDRLPTEPGALADLAGIVPDNDLYNTQSRIIFYDDVITGTYERRFKKILSQPRYFRIRDNLLYFDALYKKIQNEREPLEWHLAKRSKETKEEKDDFTLFYKKYYDYIEKELNEVERNLAKLNIAVAYLQTKNRS